MLDFKVLDIENDESAFRSGSSLQGYVSASQYNLIDVFGEPTITTPSGDDKVHTEWVLAIKVLDDDATDPDDWEKVYVRIYDWKEQGPEVARQASKYRWHIGGNSYMAQDVVDQAIKQHFGG